MSIVTPRRGPCCPKGPKIPPSVACCVPDGIVPAALRTFQAHFRGGSVAPFFISERSPLTVIGPSPGPPAPDDDPTEVVQLLAPTGSFKIIGLLGDFLVRLDSEAFCLCATMRLGVALDSGRYFVGLATPGPGALSDPTVVMPQYFGIFADGNDPNWGIAFRDDAGNTVTNNPGAPPSAPADATPHDFKLCGTPDGAGGVEFEFFVDGVSASTQGFSTFTGVYLPFIGVANSSTGDGTADLRIDEYCLQVGPPAPTPG